MAIKDKNNVEEYCYYLYLKTLHKNNPNYTNEIKAETRNTLKVVMTHGSYCGFYFTWMKDMTKIRA